MRARVALWGVVAAAVYVVAAQLSFRSGLLPVRPLYEGNAPLPPYSWVSPPPELEVGNVQPLGATATAELTSAGYQALTAGTDDGQVFVQILDDAVAVRRNEREITLRIEPLDPARFGEPPQGLLYDGNAYRITVSYASGARARLTKPATIVLRYPFAATKLFRRDGDAWVEVAPATVTSSSLQIFGDSRELGVFVAAGTGHPSPSPSASPGARGGRGDLIAALAAIAAAVIAVVAARLSRSRSTRRRRRGRKGKKPAKRSR